jgi:DNA-binding response OmpR family regulator
MRIALLEDDEQLGPLIVLWLEDAGHSVALFASGSTFMRALERESFDLLILDWTLPDTTGDKVLTWVREHIEWPIPAIFVTARDSEEEIVAGLNLGADDYIVKPLRRQEFLARVAAVARRAHAPTAPSGRLSFPPYELDVGSRSVVRGGEPIELTQKEYELALFLFRNHGRLLSRGHILQSVWGHQANITTRTVDTHVSRLRTKLALGPENGWQLNAIYNHGYRLEHLAS